MSRLAVRCRPRSRGCLSRQNRENVSCAVSPFYSPFSSRVSFYEKTKQNKKTKNLSFVRIREAQVEGGTGGQKAVLQPCSLGIANGVVTASCCGKRKSYSPPSWKIPLSTSSPRVASREVVGNFHFFFGGKGVLKIELEQLEATFALQKANQRDQGHREGPRARRGRSLLNYRQRPGGRGRTNPSLFLRRNHFALSLPNFNFSARRRRNL